MKLIERTDYLNKLIRVKNTPDIKVITGIRRSGKSKLLEYYIDYLRNTEPESNIIHVNFNLIENEHLLDYKSLYYFINNNYKEGVSNYCFIDEVQMCQDFEKAINGLHASEIFDIYITGSNAFLLSSDLATLFTGRTFEIEVYPFSYKEYLTYFNLKPGYESFDQYMLVGGMSGSYVYQDQTDRNRYINEDVFKALIVRDILQKYKIRNRNLLDAITNFMMDNIGHLMNANSISRTLTSHQEKVNDKTVASYIEYLCRSFAFYKVRRYDIKGKKYLSTDNKYYLSDHSFKYARNGLKNLDYGRVLENIAAIELLRRGYDIYVGKLYKKEIDFVAMKQSEKVYIQVSDNISEESTFKREVTPLLQIKDAYPKLLIARTRLPQYDYEGITIIDVSDWLLNELS